MILAHMGHANVFLVNAPTTKAVYKEDRCQNDANDLVAKFSRPPISLTLLAGVVESIGMTATILDCPACSVNVRKLIALLKDQHPRFVIVNTSEQTWTDDLFALKLAKREGATTLVFGYYATINARLILQHNNCIDYVITHEPEETLKELLNGQPVEQMLGLGYRLHDTVFINPQRPFIKDLDSIPFASNHLLDLGRYRNPLTGEKFLVIQVSRGCPFNCNFCLSRLMNGIQFRTRSIESVLGEIQHLEETLGIKSFFLRADTFTASKQWVKRFCTEIVKRGLKIEWYTNTRIDTLDSTLIQFLARSGCTLLSIGIESGVQSHQALLGKNLSLDRVKKTLHAIKQARLYSFAYFMMGTPFDTKATLQANINFSRQIDATFVEFEPFLDLAGIELKDRKLTPLLSTNVVQEYARRGKLFFYARPRKMLELLRFVEQAFLKFPWRFIFILKNLISYAIRVVIK